MTRELIITEAKTWLGTPYHNQASIKGVGVDCAWLLMCVYSNVGIINKEDLGSYASDWHLHRSDENYLNFVRARAKQVDVPDVGDIALFRFGRCVSHGGIMINDDTLIHAVTRVGCIQTKLDDAMLNNRLHSYWSLL